MSQNVINLLQHVSTKGNNLIKLKELVNVQDPSIRTPGLLNSVRKYSDYKN